MQDFVPFIVVLLALIAALSIGYIAWELSDRTFHDSFDQEKRHRPKDDDPDRD